MRDDLERLSTTLEVLLAVVIERRRQDLKWGQQDHDFGSWLAIFQEEFGEACHEQMEARYRPGHGGGRSSGLYDSSQQDKLDRFRKEMIESIAVLVAAVECGDRNGWFKEKP